MPITKTLLSWVEDDGGRSAAGFKGSTGDCVVRAIAIATGTPYREVYDALFHAAKTAAVKVKDPSPRNGNSPGDYGPYLIGLGWEYHSYAVGPTRHLTVEDMPAVPRFIADVRNHLCAVVDGVIRDTWNAADRYGNGRLSRVGGIWLPR